MERYDDVNEELDRLLSSAGETVDRR